MHPTPHAEHSEKGSFSLTLGATVAGTIMGTAAYMSPVQARGKAVDKRADIWAFGVVLTGKRPFHGEDVSEILASVIKDEPDLNSIPVEARRLLKSCLEKDPKKRLQAIADARLLVDESEPAPEQSRTATPRWVVAGTGVLALLALVAAAGWWRAARVPQPSLKPLVRLDVDLGPDVIFTSGRGASVIVSPGGDRLVYVSRNRLFTRRLDQSDAKELAGTDGGYAPFFSPDGRWLGFFTENKLKKIPGGGRHGGCCLPNGRLRRYGCRMEKIGPGTPGRTNDV